MSNFTLQKQIGIKDADKILLFLRQYLSGILNMGRQPPSKCELGYKIATDTDGLNNCKAMRNQKESLLSLAVPQDPTLK